MKVNFTTNKLNKDPIKITVSGVGYSSLERNIQGFREFFKLKLWGTGASIAEINVIADAFAKQQIVFVEIDDKGTHQGYLNGTLIETPTQHIHFFGKYCDNVTVREGDSLEDIIEKTQLKLVKEINQRSSFYEWVEKELTRTRHDSNYLNHTVYHQQRAIVYRKLDGMTPTSWDWERVEYNPNA